MDQGVRSGRELLRVMSVGGWCVVGVKEERVWVFFAHHRDAHLSLVSWWSFARRVNRERGVQ